MWLCFRPRKIPFLCLPLRPLLFPDWPGGPEGPPRGCGGAGLGRGPACPPNPRSLHSGFSSETAPTPNRTPDLWENCIFTTFSFEWRGGKKREREDIMREGRSRSTSCGTNHDNPTILFPDAGTCLSATEVLPHKRTSTLLTLISPHITPVTFHHLTLHELTSLYLIKPS